MDFFGHPVEETLDQLPIVALVLAAEDIALDAEPEEGEAAERAAAADRAEDEADRAEGRERDVDEAS
jgi:hypothetical protein